MNVLTLDTHTKKINSTIFTKACGFTKYTVTTPLCKIYQKPPYMTKLQHLVHFSTCLPECIIPDFKDIQSQALKQKKYGYLSLKCMWESVPETLTQVSGFLHFCPAVCT